MKMKMYLPVIREIFSVKFSSGLNRKETMELADKAGFTLLTFNGLIYSQNESGEWFQTDFVISDFEVN